MFFPNLFQEFDPIGGAWLKVLHGIIVRSNINITF